MTEKQPELILICNDDGVHAPGIEALAKAAEVLGEVWVVAPDREQSAVGHGISLDKPLREVRLGERRSAISGTPADCVYFAVSHRLPRTPTLVMSGINRGNNMADDVFYSGTVAAAMEGCLMGIPSIAVSLGVGGDLSVAAQVAVDLAREVLLHGLPERCLLNVNIPRRLAQPWELRICSLGLRFYGREIANKSDPRGRPYYWIGGPELGFAPIRGSDCVTLDEGHVSVTPVRLDLNDDALSSALSEWSLFGPRSAGNSQPRMAESRANPNGGAQEARNNSPKPDNT
ncbi:MAG: 5'/3'-nucleotidase SurE [Deltaproteobacteria bacterium CG2_30_63_29]|nr:MAG: 5'/3'-nucleotidase SurE [Deltaproteobacteria bacterium CG2_30_63_29]PJB40256.1 MAG: 5'/3'-nucleotidase SurE [Deltaproteobacteria bacterium CG_4_9_14_3_um_filter_63_12]